MSLKKYANRRLYNTGTSTYVTLDDLAVMVKKGEEFTVQDAKSGDDITHSVLTQIIFEQESKTGNTLLPISFLRQLISFYGDQMQMVVPSYLEHSMQAFTDQQVTMREQINKAFGDTPLGKNLTVPLQLVEEQVKRNTDLFHQAMQMFSPFMAATPATKEPRKAEAKDIDELKEQLRALQTKLEKSRLTRLYCRAAVLNGARQLSGRNYSPMDTSRPAVRIDTENPAMTSMKQIVIRMKKTWVAALATKRNSTRKTMNRTIESK